MKPAVVREHGNCRGAVRCCQIPRHRREGAKQDAEVGGRNRRTGLIGVVKLLVALVLLVLLDLLNGVNLGFLGCFCSSAVWGKCGSGTGTNIRGGAIGPRNRLPPTPPMSCPRSDQPRVSGCLDRECQGTVSRLKGGFRSGLGTSPRIRPLLLLPRSGLV